MLHQGISECCIFPPMFGCCTPPNAGQNGHFQNFFARKLKKRKKISKFGVKLSKKTFFWLARKHWLTVLFPRKGAFFY